MRIGGGPLPSIDVQLLKGHVRGTHTPRAYPPPSSLLMTYQQVCLRHTCLRAGSQAHANHSAQRWGSTASFSYVLCVPGACFPHASSFRVEVVLCRLHWPLPRRLCTFRSNYRRGMTAAFRTSVSFLPSSFALGRLLSRIALSSLYHTNTNTNKRHTHRRGLLYTLFFF